jgi:hypothetical protein
MNEHDFGGRSRPQKRKASRDCGDKSQYLLSAEEQLLSSISARAPLPEMLNGICSALDCQIGGVVSLISIPVDDTSDVVTVAVHAALFGLFVFCAERVVAENDELLGTLEMYSSVARLPTANELQLIERARCLAAIAIKLDKEAGHKGIWGARPNRSVRGRTLEWPVSMN